MSRHDEEICLQTEKRTSRFEIMTLFQGIPGSCPPAVDQQTLKEWSWTLIYGRGMDHVDPGKIRIPEPVSPERIELRKIL
jgi:hypothetical protein